MPPSGFSKEVVKGALEFVGGCYRDLLNEVRSGKHESVEAAIEYELQQIGKVLESIHINDAGVLVSKENPAEPLHLR